LKAEDLCDAGDRLMNRFRARAIVLPQQPSRKSFIGSMDEIADRVPGQFD
jgi:hypothetical protein